MKYLTRPGILPAKKQPVGASYTSFRLPMPAALNGQYMSEVLALKSIDVPFNGNSIKLIGSNWSDNGATTFIVRLNETGELAEVAFTGGVGIRILEELDLASWWMEASGAQLSDSWLFHVSSGGWFDFESTRDDFYKKHESDKPKEYLITGYQECASILAYSEPSVRVLNTI